MVKSFKPNQKCKRCLHYGGCNCNPVSNINTMDDKTIKYIKKRTKNLTPSERKMWVDRISDYFRRESIDYVNGKPIPVDKDIEFIAEVMLTKDDEPEDGAYTE